LITIENPKGAPSLFSSEEHSDSNVYVIGVYQTHGNHGFNKHPSGSAMVRIEEQSTPITLVLGAYEPVNWTLEGPGSVKIQRLILIGYHEQNVIGPPAEVVPEKYTYEKPTANYRISSIQSWPAAQDVCLELKFSRKNHREYQRNRKRCARIETKDKIEELIGSPVTAFAGAYEAKTFRIHSTSR